MQENKRDVFHFRNAWTNTDQPDIYYETTRWVFFKLKNVLFTNKKPVILLNCLQMYL